MGWNNFIIVPSLKLVVEVSRQLDSDSARTLAESFCKLFDEEKSICDLLDRQYSKLSAKEFSLMVSKADDAENLSGRYSDDLFAVWLILRKIDFQIMSEFDFGKFDRKGFTVLRLD